MHRLSLGRACRPTRALLALRLPYRAVCRTLNTEAINYESKYADKLEQRAKEKGVSVNQLKAEAQKKLEEEKIRVREAYKKASEGNKIQGQEKKIRGGETEASSNTRQDSSPIKPLSSILNLSRIASLNASQIGALWAAYHASRSDGTGRGYLCAAIPVDLYEKMAKVGTKYPLFVLPIPRPKQPTATEETADAQKEADNAYEFYFMEWAFHEPPPGPSAAVAAADPFSKPPQTQNDASNMPISTILFTPLIEYKMRNSFATPYLVLTHYTDLAKTHGIVLLRGEITPTSAGNGHLLSQEDAQVLSVGLQKFYLWDNTSADSSNIGERMLKAFHENPDTFNWQELLQYGTHHL
ncbi:ATP11-domain-containing protein [Marasmius fiardii PR-910]|nr:ATP11-domain-containing protein [Marasmius fiardii PR-910]